jgi:hypothetical protein
MEEAFASLADPPNRRGALELNDLPAFLFYIGLNLRENDGPLPLSQRLARRLC